MAQSICARLCAIAVLAPLASSAAHADTLQVSVSGGTAYASISAAVAAASSGDVIEVGPGTYAEAIDLGGKALQLRSSEGAAATHIDANGAVDYALRVPHAGDQVTVIDGFTLRNGAGNGVLVDGARIDLLDLRFEGLGAGGDGSRGQLDQGGGLHARDGALVVATGLWFEGCRGTWGAGVALINSELRGVNLTLLDGDASEGGGAVYVEGSSRLDLSQSSLLDNQSGNSGGALYLTGPAAQLQLSDSELSDNTGYDGYGGAVYMGDGVNATIQGSSFYDNEVTYGYGGAIWAEYEVDLEMSGTTLEGNTAYRSGGAIGFWYTYGTLGLTDVTLADNTATNGHGGAVYSYVHGELELDGVEVVNNTALYHGGGLYLYYYSGLQLVDSSVVGNTSRRYSGGGVYSYYSYSGDLNLVSGSLVQGNSAALEGGGLFFRSHESLRIEDSQLVDNDGDPGMYGGGLFAAYVTTNQVHDSVFAGNRATYGGGAYEGDNQGTSTWTNNVLVENSAQIGGAACFVSHEGLSVVNNSLVGNLATESAGAVCLHEARGQVVNNVFAYTSSGAALEAWDLNSGFYTDISYNDWFDNPEGDTAREIQEEHIGEGNLEQAPQFATWSPDGDPRNDSFVLALGSPLIDAGHPDLLDPDGSRSDVGAMGGPLLVPEDLDGDGFDDLSDCDDADAQVYPGATETWYDGVNQDCMPGSDYDQDGDGADAMEFDGADCDDADPEVLDCPEETGDDTGQPQDSDDPIVGVPPEGRCEGCAQGGSAPAGVLVFMAMLLARRRGDRPEDPAQGTISAQPVGC